MTTIIVYVRVAVYLYDLKVTYLIEPKLQALSYKLQGDKIRAEKRVNVDKLNLN